MKYLKCLIFILLFFVAGCSSPNKLFLTKKDFNELENWHKDDMQTAYFAFKKSCKNVDQSMKDEIHYNKLFNLKKLEKVCKKTIRSNIKNFFRKNFTPFLVTNYSNEEGLFTGYYEISLKGKRKKDNIYKYPIYKLPPNLDKIKENLTREEINKGALNNKGLEIAYTDDPVMLFFMHIQGSGRLYFPNNKFIKLGYNGQNGHKYTSIGKILIDEEGLDKDSMSAETIIDWMRQNPIKADNLMERNASYIFFREYSTPGPIGAQQVALTANRSLAVDNNFIPFGYPLWLETSYPDGKKLDRLMVAQDKGGAIKGVVRGDIFFGSNIRAEKLAWHMKSKGKYYIFIPK